MLVMSVFRSSIQTAVIEDEGTVYLYGEQADICVRNGKAAVSAKGKLHVLGNSAGSEGEHVTLQFEEHIVQLYFFSSDGYRYYSKVKAAGILTIGNDIEDDIYIRSEDSDREAIRVDTEKRTVKVIEGIIAGLNGRRIQRSAIYRKGDILEYMNLRIFFHDKFLKINKCTGTCCVLPYADTAVSSEIHQNYEQIRIRKQSTVLIPSIPEEIALPKRQEVIERGHRSVLLSAGPSFLMGLSSLISTAMMQKMNMDSMSADHLLPLMLLPGTMMISALLFPLLNRLSDRQTEKKRRKKEEEEYQRLVHETIQWVADRRTEVQNMIETYYPSQCQSDFRYVTDDKKPIYLRMGKAQKTMSFALSDTENDANDQISELADDNVFRPYLIDLNRYSHIAISFEESLPFLYQLTERLSHYDLPLILVADESRIPMFLPLLQRECFLTKDGKRRVMTKLSQMSDLHKMIDKNERCILICAQTFPMNDSFKEVKGIKTRIDTNEDQADLRFFEVNDIRYAMDSMVCDQRLFVMDEVQYRTVYTGCELLHEKDERKNCSFLNCHNLKHSIEREISEEWKKESNDSLKAIIGLDHNDNPIVLDLNERKDGPHGLVAGTTGSGKSELLSTIILSLACSCSPERLQFLLIDFKGGGVISSFQNSQYSLPHIAGTVTDLDLDTRNRAICALRELCRKRERAFLEMSNEKGRGIRKIGEYNKECRKNGSVPQMAELVIIVDEFAQLKKECPEFLKELITIARIGRSLGIHLILATQRPAGMISDEIRANTKFRICMRVEDRTDSMEVLHIPDACILKEPGEFILLRKGKTAAGRCAYVNAEIGNSDPLYEGLSLQRNTVSTLWETSSDKPTELAEVMKSICNISQEYNNNAPLWYPKLPVLKRNTEQNHIAFAKADLIDQIRQPYIIFEKGQIYAFFTAETERKDELLRTLLWCGLHNGPTGIVISASSLCRTSFEEYNNVFAYSSVTEGICGSIAKNAIRTMLVFELPKERNELDQLFDHCMKNEIRIAVITETNRNFSFTQMARITRRFCFADLSIQEISTILESKVTLDAYADDAGFYKEECTGVFRLIQTEKEDLKPWLKRKIL